MFMHSTHLPFPNWPKKQYGYTHGALVCMTHGTRCCVWPFNLQQKYKYSFCNIIISLFSVILVYLYATSGFFICIFFVIFSVLPTILFEYSNKKHNLSIFTVCISNVIAELWKWVGLFTFCHSVNIALKITWCCLHDGIYVKCTKFEMDGEIGGGRVGLFSICNKILMLHISTWKGALIQFRECMYDVRYIFIAFR